MRGFRFVQRKLCWRSISTSPLATSTLTRSFDEVLVFDQRRSIQRRCGARSATANRQAACVEFHKKSGFTALVKPPVDCFVRFPSADHGSLPVTWYTATQPFASTPPPVVQIAGTDCPVKAVLAIGT